MRTHRDYTPAEHEEGYINLLLDLLDSDYGISEAGYLRIQKVISDVFGGNVPQSILDIYNKVNATDGMFYLPKEN